MASKLRVYKLGRVSRMFENFIEYLTWVITDLMPFMAAFLIVAGAVALSIIGTASFVSFIITKLRKGERK